MGESSCPIGIIVTSIMSGWSVGLGNNIIGCYNNRLINYSCYYFPYINNNYTAYYNRTLFSI